MCAIALMFEHSTHKKPYKQLEISRNRTQLSPIKSVSIYDMYAWGTFCSVCVCVNSNTDHDFTIAAGDSVYSFFFCSCVCVCV